jgi:hypothetical protein
MSRRPPRDLGGLLALPRLQHDRIGTPHHDALAGLQHVIVEVAPAREPHAAPRHHEFPGPAMEEHGLAPGHGKRRVVGIRLHFHHQSPGCRHHWSSRRHRDIRACDAADPMNSVTPFDADLI